MNVSLMWLDESKIEDFPHPSVALDEPDGLLAVGGDLSSERLIKAYRSGIFPWFSDNDPILWWSPNPRMCFFTNKVHLSKRFKKEFKKSNWTITADRNFSDIITICANTPRHGQPGTWITDDMKVAYCELHRLGYAHSIEVRNEADQIVGGLYGVAIGNMFFGESMFSKESGGSKIALAALAFRLNEWEWPLLDAQVENPHLIRMGGCLLERDVFLRNLAELTQKPFLPQQWNTLFGVINARDLCL